MGDCVCGDHYDEHDEETFSQECLVCECEAYEEA